jgi:RNA polymerase sigma factor (TIGR02999 family)
MSDVTRLVEAAQAALAAARMAHEKPGQTLNATALVHEAYLRLVGEQHFDGRGHFFAAAAEAMRRILVENARRKGRRKHGGGLERVELAEVPAPAPDDELLALDAALEALALQYPEHARLVTLRYFTGLTLPEAARALSISDATADRRWAFAKAWLRAELADPVAES